MAFRAAFGTDTTTEEVLAGIDLTGKRAIVTGSSVGIGEETARSLASHGAAVTLAGRSLARAEAAAERIRRSMGSPNIDARELKLSEPDSVRAFAEDWFSRYESLDILINNAGIMAVPLERTAEGWEMQLAVNHLGHFLLTCLLVPALRAAAPSRVITLTSAAHKISDVDWDDPYFEHRAYDESIAYGQSKTANILFSVELNRRLAPQGVTANAVHPGSVSGTELVRHWPPGRLEAARKQFFGPGAKTKTIPAGAATSVWAATSPDLEGRGGLYLEDCHVGELNTGDRKGVGYASYALDPEHAARLWQLSEQAIGQSFDLA